MQSFSYKVSCFGAGFVGLPTSVVLAIKNPNVDFIVYDINQKRIKQCQNGQCPIYEPNLQETLKILKDKNLSFSSNIKDGLDDISVIFLALPTPSKIFGQYKGKAYDLSYTEKAIRSIIEYYNKNKMNQNVILVQKSTVPIGTAQMITNIIQQVSIKQNINKYIVTSNPQFLSEGSAIKDLINPDRVVIGAKQGANLDKLKSLYNYVKKQAIIQISQYSSELSKLVANCFLAQRVSSINSMAILCQSYNADITQVRQCIATDSRIGNKFLMSSVGFGGSCFKKDILALIYLAQIKGLIEVANYWNAVISINQYRKRTFFLRIYDALNKNLVDKKLCIFGTAFKKDTNDARQSPAVQICNYLLLQGAILHIYDPQTTLKSLIDEIKLHELWRQQFMSRLIQFKQSSSTPIKTHAIIILTQWDQFKTYDYLKFYQNMEKPSYIFDGRNILNNKEIKAIGFKYYSVGHKYYSQ